MDGLLSVQKTDKSSKYRQQCDSSTSSGSSRMISIVVVTSVIEVIIIIIINFITSAPGLKNKPASQWLSYILLHLLPPPSQTPAHHDQVLSPTTYLPCFQTMAIAPTSSEEGSIHQPQPTGSGLIKQEVTPREKSEGVYWRYELALVLFPTSP